MLVCSYIFRVDTLIYQANTRRKDDILQKNLIELVCISCMKWIKVVRSNKKCLVTYEKYIKRVHKSYVSIVCTGEAADMM